jgi:Arc/MetJ-type ribon-helix-helix transcriptional regulator
MEKMKQQLHIDIASEQLRKFKAAVKALGYGTMSEYIRAKIRQAIREAEQIDQGVS